METPALHSIPSRAILFKNSSTEAAKKYIKLKKKLKKNIFRLKNEIANKPRIRQTTTSNLNYNTKRRK